MKSTIGRMFEGNFAIPSKFHPLRLDMQKQQIIRKTRSDESLSSVWPVQPSVNGADADRKTLYLVDSAVPYPRTPTKVLGQGGRRSRKRKLKIQGRLLQMIDPSQSGLNLNGVQVLLVDDNRNYRLLGQTLLQQYGATVVLAENGAEALEEVKKGNYDLVLMDIEMPVMDGVSSTREIRQLPGELASIPILAVTSHSLPEEYEAYRAAGINAVVSKPFETRELLEQVMALLPGKTMDVKEGEQEESYLDLSDLWDKARGHTAFVIQMLEIFLEDYPMYLEQLEELLMQEDWEQVKKVAHRMKSPASVIRTEVVLENLRFFEYYDTTSTERETMSRFAALKNASWDVIRDAKRELRELKEKQ